MFLQHHFSNTDPILQKNQFFKLFTIMKINLAIILSLLFQVCLLYSQYNPLYYFDQEQPDNIPVRFAPDVISLDNRKERTPNYTPGFDEFYFTTTASSSADVYITRLNDSWKEPEKFTGFLQNVTDLSFSESGNLATFTSWEGDYDNFKDTDIWIVERDGNGWGEPEKLPYPINTWSQEWGACILDNRTVYVCQIINNQPDICRYIYQDGEYIKTELTGVNTSSQEWDPYVPEDESYMIFKSNRPGSIGGEGMDLYISYKKEDGNYTTPLNLGEPINTSQHEDGGTLSPDGKFFLFARSDGAGSFDIYWVSADFVEENNPGIPASTNRSSFPTGHFYPNPVTDKIYVKGSMYSHSQYYRVLDINGNLIKSGNVTENVINVSQINAGIYFLQLLQKGKLISEPIIIE